MRAFAWPSESDIECLRLLNNGQWGATLRIGLSMPQVCLFQKLDDPALAASLAAMTAEIETELAKLL